MFNFQLHITGRDASYSLSYCHASLDWDCWRL